MLTEEKIIDKIEIINDAAIQVREANIIKRDGVEISRTFNRWVVYPSDDISTQSEKVQAIAKVIWGS
jgi:hypothetical protein